MEAQSQSAGRTLLWQRWSSEAGNASPFGICLRPVDSPDTKAPFPSWEYRLANLPDPLFMNIGEAGVEDPMWVYLNFMQRVQREQWSIEHPIGTRQITGLTLATPLPFRSAVAQTVVENGILSSRTGTTSLLEIEFDGNRRNEHVDFKPHLPFVFQL